MSKKSPFPGMDPWLEKFWGDVHTRLTTYASDQLQPGLPSGLRARVEEYVTVESKEEDQNWRRHYVPDVMVSQAPSPVSQGEEAATATIVETEALDLPRVREPITLRRIQIVDTQSGDRVITSIEFLSPSNKIGQGREIFKLKQQDFLEGGVNIVEIDLIRSGQWSVSIPQDYIPSKRRTPYRAVVVRASSWMRCEYYPITIGTPMPKLKIPLRDSDPDVSLDLQALLDLAYVNGAYQDAIDYKQPLPQPFSPAIQGWIENWLKTDTECSRHPESGSLK
jgi:hypothetical protein